MIDRERFELIKRKHGGYASWAVWAPATHRPKSNIDDLSIFDIDINPTTLSDLQGNVVMVGLNISRSFGESFRNFHDRNSSANDFKIRYAFTGTVYYGAYMTDAIKNVRTVTSAGLQEYLRVHPEAISASFALLREELRDLGCKRPTILAFGSAAYTLLTKDLVPQEYSVLIRLTHYSQRIGKEKYKKTVMRQIHDHP